MESSEKIREAGSPKGRRGPFLREEAHPFELPFLATVDKLVEDRGFALALCDFKSGPQLLHVSRGPSDRHDFSGIAVGDRVFCQFGSDPRKPGQTCVVQWLPVDDLDWDQKTPPSNQSELDALRRDSLRKRVAKDPRKLLGASWYAQMCGGATTPDLQDPVLSEVWIERLAQLDPDELRKEWSPEVLKSCLYDFRTHLDPESPNCLFKTLLATFSPPQLAALGEPQNAWLQRIVDEEQIAVLLEWFLLSSAQREPKDGFKVWLTGRAKYEAVVAERIFERGDAVSDAVRQWACSLACNGWVSQALVDRLAADEVSAAVLLFERLTSESQREKIASWTQSPELMAVVLQNRPSLGIEIASRSALAVDLETDGERIWEIGCAQGDGAARLHDEQAGTDLSVALTDLGERVSQSAIVVGQNILAWDWPILAPRLALEAQPVIWDTLLVAFLLEPQAASHALGGTHHADEDAVATLTLFVRQLAQFPTPFKVKLLSGQFGSTDALFESIVEALADAGFFSRPAPSILQDSGYSPSRMLLLPEASIRALDWVPGVAVVQADPQQSLSSSFWQIDAARLESVLTGELLQDPFARVLLAIVRRAAAEGVLLRRGTLPAWLVDHSPDLSASVDLACVIPARGAQICVSPLPESAAWWAQADASTVRAVLPDGPVLIVDREASLDDASAQIALKHSAPLLRIGGGPLSQWAYRDRTAALLDLRGGWRCFRTVTPTKALVVEPLPPAAPASRPIVLTRAQPALHPGSVDQAAYWMGVLQSFREASQLAPDAVPVLLVGSTASHEMVGRLETALAEIGMGEIRPVYRSYREHLRRAAQQGLGVVDFVARWQNWQTLATEAGIALQPVVEALPVEEWHALADAVTIQSDAIGEKDAEAVSPKPGAPIKVAGAELLEALPRLVRQFFLPWLERSGLSSFAGSAMIIDPRADFVSQQLRTFMESRPLTGSALSAASCAKLNVVFAPLQVKREQAPSDFASMERFLVANWQPANSGGNEVKGFTEPQIAPMEAICTRASDVMVSLPTGGGKSVLFQVPALCRGLRNRRLTLVLSPLKALMEDQVARLHEQGPEEQSFAESVDFLSGDRTKFEIAEVLHGILDHRIVLLYVAPERLRSPSFVDVLTRRIESDGGLEYVVFDETHCVNQWGYEFRPDYFYAFKSLLQRLRQGEQPEPTPFLLMSATITASDQKNLEGLLRRGSCKEAELQLKIFPAQDQFSNPLRSHIQVKPVPVQGNIFESKNFEAVLSDRLPRIVDVIRQAQQSHKDTGQRSAVIVFVSRRAHADDIARRLADVVSCDVESFHAGLDAGTRKDIYSRFKDGSLGVLVATKAFGMGMDIPDIHWVVHISPPTYLEDYLQEVGRIGRGEKQRKLAGFSDENRLSAILLFSGSDFENMRGLRKKNELIAPYIRDVEEKLIYKSQVIEGQKIVVVPEHGYQSFKSAGEMRANATRLRMSLHWLEKAEHLNQLGTVADLVSVELSPTKLSAIGEEQSTVGAAARAVLSLTSAQAEDDVGGGFVRPSAGGSGSLFSRLADTIGLVVGARPNAASGSRVLPNGSKAIINLSQIRLRCQFKSLDDAMASVVELQRRGGLSLQWQLEFAARPLLAEPSERRDRLFKSIGAAVRQLVSRLGANGRLEFHPFEWLEDDDWGVPEVVPSPNGIKTKEKEKERESLLKFYQRAYLHGFRSLARASGVRLQQAVREQGEAVVWRALLPCAENRAARGRCDDLLKMAQSLLPIFADAAAYEKDAVEVYGLIRRIQEAHPQKQFHQNDLKSLLLLYSSMYLVSTHPQILPMSYILALGNLPVGLEAHPELIEELNQVNDLAEARNFAMEVFANLPDKVRDGFITRYFAQAGAPQLKSFLEAELGDIEDGGEGSSSFILGKREQLRATEATKFFAKYQASEEPAQWAAMQHPYDQHLLVNAGPGAGKTTVLVGRIAHLIREQRIKPSEIVVLAFNRDVVFEIKKRIRELFKALGYAAYVEQVRISTFHALAMRSLYQSEDRDAQVSRDSIMPVFAAKMRSDSRFREQVAGGCRSILVDEFQDVTSDVYSIIRNLHLGSGGRAGVMAIGDDDQDILRWHRVNDGACGEEQFAEAYFDRFKREFGGEKLTLLDLAVNFRSGTEIVTRSQKMISGFFGDHKYSRRLKNTKLRPVDEAAADQCERIDWRGRNWVETVSQVAERCRLLLAQNPGSLVVLCRSNSEVAQLHHRLVRDFPDFAVQSSMNMRIADLRHVARWIDFVEEDVFLQDCELTEALKAKLFGEFKEKFPIPETSSTDRSGVDLAVLWDLCCEEHVFPHLSNLIRFLKSLQTDELQRLLESRQSDAKPMVVSTIHKVKGLEYDNVIVAPSKTPFSKDTVSADSLENDAAEEARLLYVAMTRAKTRLVYFMGDREYGWAYRPRRAVSGEHGQNQILVGGHDEVSLSWAISKEWFNPDSDGCQRYIEQEVRVGDPIMLGGAGAGAFC